MFSVDDRAVKRLESDLKEFAAKALPFATRNTINGGAFLTRKIALVVIGSKMTERNRFTTKSVQVRPERQELNIRRQEARVGSIAPYMETQEFGGIKKKTGKHGVAIPTSEASGEGSGVFPRKKIVRKPNKLANMKFTNRRNQGSRKQRNRVAIMEAISTKRRFIFLDLGRRSGIYRVLGGKRNPRIKKMWDLSKRTVIIPKRPWLAPATKKAEKSMQTIYRKSIEFQLKRKGLFRG